MSAADERKGRIEQWVLAALHGAKVPQNEDELTELVYEAFDRVKWFERAYNIAAAKSLDDSGSRYDLEPDSFEPAD